MQHRTMLRSFYALPLDDRCDTKVILSHRNVWVNRLGVYSAGRKNSSGDYTYEPLLGKSRIGVARCRFRWTKAYSALIVHQLLQRILVFSTM